MPSENFHVCDIDTSLRVVGSEKRTHKGKPYTIRFGIPKGGGGSKEYAYYYPKTGWTSVEARAHCKSHGGKKFEPAIAKAQEFSDEYGLE